MRNGGTPNWKTYERGIWKKNGLEALYYKIKLQNSLFFCDGLIKIRDFFFYMTSTKVWVFLCNHLTKNVIFFLLERLNKICNFIHGLFSKIISYFFICFFWQHTLKQFSFISNSDKINFFFLNTRKVVKWHHC